MVDELLLQANHYINLKKYDKALLCANKALAENPDSEEALYIRAVCLIIEEQFDEALETCSQLRESAYRLEEIEELYALIYINQEDATNAEEHLLEALRINPHNASALARYSVLMYESGSMEKGRALMAEATKIDPLNPVVLEFRMLLFKNSEEDFLNYTKHEDDELDKLINMGNHFLAKNNMRNAQECFAQAITMDPSNQELVTLLNKLDMELSPLFFPLRIFWKINTMVFWVLFGCSIFFVYLLGFQRISFVLIIVFFSLALYSLIAKPLYKLIHRNDD